MRAVKERPDLELVGEAGDGRDALEQIKLAGRRTSRCSTSACRGSRGTQVLSALRARRDRQPRCFSSPPSWSPSWPTRRSPRARRATCRRSRSRQEICDAIVTVSRGDTALAPEVQAGLAQEIMQRERADGRPDLSPRESEVLHMIAEGLSAPDIAKQIHLSPTTVKTHLGHALREARRIRPRRRGRRGHEARPARMSEDADLRAEIEELRRRARRGRGRARGPQAVRGAGHGRRGPRAAPDRAADPRRRPAEPPGGEPGPDRGRAGPRAGDQGARGRQRDHRPAPRSDAGAPSGDA